MKNHKNASKFMLLMLIYLTIISNFIVFLIIRIFPILTLPNYLGITQIIGSIVYFFTPFLIYIKIKKLDIGLVLPLEKLSFKNVLVIIFLSFAVQPSLQLLAAITDLFFKNDFSAAIPKFLNLKYFQLISAVAIFPAILEEIVFRGIILSKYKTSSIFIGVFFSSLFFGMMHLTVSQLFYATIAGVFLALLVKVTRSIYSSILAHFILNGSQITLAYFTTKLLPDSVSKESYINSFTNSDSINKYSVALYALYNFVSSLPFLILLIYIFVKINGENILELKKENKTAKEKKERIFNVYFILSVLLYILYLVVNN